MPVEVLQIGGPEAGLFLQQQWSYDRGGAGAVEVLLKVLVKKEQWWRLKMTTPDMMAMSDHPNIILLPQLTESEIRPYLVKVLVEDQQLCKCI